jgi:hypothetical protein
MKSKIVLTAIASLAVWASTLAIAEDFTIENFQRQPEARWQFFADTVMGGVSTGQVEFVQANGDAYARMTGRVSTENNGGFIQFRMELLRSLPKDAVGLRLVIRGNDKRYFVHLRTSGMLLPWQYYQAGFDTTREWSKVRLPFTAFKASSRLLRTKPKPETIRSIGIVAFGRNHQAEIDVREVSYY